jgi:two-component system, LytTR family, sensor histidine kinase AlgZ
MDLKIKFRALHLPPGPGHPDLLLPDFCRGEGVLGAVVLAELLAILIVLAARGLYPFDWLMLGEVSLLVLWITLLSALGLCLLRSRLSGLSRAAVALCCFALIIAITALCSTAGQILLLWWQPQTSLAFFSFWPVLQHMAIAAIPAGILLRQLFLQQELRLQQRAELEARIQALQSRIRPHFLFNSMNMIASLIGSDPDKAERVVEDLADLFRHALAESNTMVPLREELSLCRRYLALEKLRLGERLETLWEIGDYGSGVRIPCLTIQPVLENAVYHGIQLIPEGGVLGVRVNRVGDRIDITVTNPRNPRIQHNKGNRMAMSNIRTRLEAHFGPGARVEAEVTDENYITRISYPVPAEVQTS